MVWTRSLRSAKGVQSKYFATTKLEVKSEEKTIKIPKIKDEADEVMLKEEEEDIKPVIKKRKLQRKESPALKVEMDDESKTVPDSGGKQPKNWLQLYNLVKEMRMRIIAPVDTMGCAEIPRTLNHDVELSPKNYRFQLLISLMLSSQTKDEVNFKAMNNMKVYFQKNGFEQGLTIDGIRWIEEKKLDELIFSVGFHTRKAKYIKETAEILHMNWSDDIPNTLEGLLALPGVGPKMSYLTLQKAWDLNLGIGVDTHVDRLCKMWGWVPKNTKNPEQTRIELEKWLPKEYWNEINPVLVGFGQSVCLPRGRRCDLCTLKSTRLCPNVDRALLKKVSKLNDNEKTQMNDKLRGNVTMLQDIEDLV